MPTNTVMNIESIFTIKFIQSMYNMWNELRIKSVRHDITSEEYYTFIKLKQFWCTHIPNFITILKNLLYETFWSTLHSMVNFDHMWSILSMSYMKNKIKWTMPKHNGYHIYWSLFLHKIIYGHNYERLELNYVIPRWRGDKHFTYTVNNKTYELYKIKCKREDINKLEIRLIINDLEHEYKKYKKHSSDLC
jgi:hypothetical protein